MGYITALFLLAASFHFCVSDELCPSSSVISPCTCDGEGINCMKVRTDSDLQRIFRSIPKPWKFRGVWIQITDMTILPSGMFKGIEAQAFHIEINKIHTVQSGAFSGSEQSVYSISVFGNQLSSYPFEDLKNFVYLQSFNAGRNRITSIPEKAFYGLQYLNQILLAENIISFIGPNAFNGLPNLMRLDMLHNRMNILGPSSLAMSSHNPQLTINLANNSIASVNPTAFTGVTPTFIHLALNRLPYLDEASFLPMVQRMAKIGGRIELSNNPFSCMGCVFRWIVLNKAVLQHMFGGFRCLDGRTLQRLDSWNIMCTIPYL